MFKVVVLFGMSMENEMAAENLKVTEANGKLCNDGSFVLDDSSNENGMLNVDLLDDLDSYWEDINDRLTISRMVSDSVIKGMVNAVTQDATERIAQKERELAGLKEALKLYHVSANGNGFLGSTLTQHKLNSIEMDAFVSCADALVKQDKMSESLCCLKNVAREQFKKLIQEINEIRECGTNKKRNPNSVGLGGILLEKVPKIWVDVDETLDSLRTSLDSVYKQVDDMVCVSKASLSDWQLEHDFRGGIEDIVIKSCLQNFQDELEEMFWDRNGTLYSSKSSKWNEKMKEILSLRQELDAICKSFSAPEIGLLTPHAHLEVGEERNNNKWTDNFHRTVSGSHVSSSTSIWEGNGKPEESIIVPETLDGGQLKHMENNELVLYFKAEMTKMKRYFESREELITDKYFSLRREYLKENGSSLASKREKEFNMLRKKIPEVILKLDDILGQNVKLPTVSKHGDSLISLKERFDSIVLENHQLRNLLMDKESEVKSLSSEVLHGKEKIYKNFLVEEKLVKLIGELKCGIEDAHLHTSICEDVYKCVFRELTDHIECNAEESEMKSRIMQEFYEVVFKQAVQNAESANYDDDSGMESIIMQYLLDVVLTEVIKEANEKLNMSHKRYAEEKEVRGSLEVKTIETEKALRFEIAEKERLLQEILLLDASLKEKESFILEAETGLEKTSERFELALQELNSLREHASRQQMVISESSKASDMMKGDLDKAHELIAMQKLEICQLQQKLVQNDQEKKMLDAAIREKQNALSLVVGKEREYKKQLDSITPIVLGLSKIADDLEGRMTEEIKTINLRLESMNSQFNDVLQKANSLRSTGLIYKQKLEKRCSDLQKAEAEVDLLGDEVNVLLSLLEKIYIALDHYSPVLKHYPGIMEILKLVRRELNGEPTKSA